MLPLKSLTSALPQNLCATIEQAIHKLSTDCGVDDKPQLLAALVFRSYELYQISIIFRELNSSPRLAHFQAIDYNSQLIHIIAIS